jgi:hypothetical protein
MEKLIVLFYFILALAGCDHTGRTIVMRGTADGTDIIYSRVHDAAGTASFACIRSQSGECHYAVFEHDCSRKTACASMPFAQFAVTADTTHDIANLPSGFVLCVSTDAKPMTSKCLRG